MLSKAPGFSAFNFILVYISRSAQPLFYLFIYLFKEKIHTYFTYTAICQNGNLLPSQFEQTGKKRAVPKGDIIRSEKALLYRFLFQVKSYH